MSLPELTSTNDNHDSPDSERTSISSMPSVQRRKGPQRVLTQNPAMTDPLLTVDDVGRRLNVSKDWVWDHCWRKSPRLPVIRMGDGALRFRASAIEEFINERERLSTQRSVRR
jgi:predicted DNA-binding transcriptional regulator AlpA